MSEKISMINLKGGVGKTVSSINIAYSFAEFGKKVLIVDTDSQGNIATSLGVNPDELNVTLFHLMEKAISGVVTKEEVQECLLNLGDVDVLPSNSKLAEIDYRLMNAYRREFILNDIISVVEDMYDYIIIDCPPSLSLIVTNALVASNHVLIPVEAHYLSFESLKVMLGTIEMVRIKLNPDLKIAGVFLTMYQSRTKLSKGIKEQLCGIYGDDIKVFDKYIPYSIKAAEQTLLGKSLTVDENGVLNANATGTITITTTAKSGVTEEIEIEVYSNAGSAAAGVGGVAIIGAGVAYYLKRKKSKDNDNIE